MPLSSAHSQASRLRWLYPVALACMVVVASSRSQVAAPLISYFDKIAHFSIFGLLGTLIARCPGVRRFRYAIAIVSLFGISDEFRQSFTPGRSVEFADWMADTLGAATAVALYAFWPAYRRLLETPLRLFRKTNATAPLPAGSPPAEQAASAT